MEEENRKDKDPEAQEIDEFEKEKLVENLEEVYTIWIMWQKDIWFDDLVAL